MTGLQALEELGLESLSPEGKIPTPSRLTSAQTLRDLYTHRVRDDQSSAIARVRVQAVKDGEPPFNQAALNASGQGSRANFNDLMMDDIITKVSHGYNDIATSPKDLITVELDGTDEPNARANNQRVIAAELTRTIRKWPSFVPNFLRLVDLFVTHGVGVAYFPDSQDFRFEVCGLGEFLIPRQTPASEEKVPYAIARKDMLVTDLYDSIRNEKVAEKLGWNVAAVKAAIGRATTKASNGELGEIEMFQRQIKNNDLNAARKFEHIVILHGWVKEFDGTYSYFICENDAPDGDFLFKEYSRFKSVSEAFTFFCYGIGNGTYHSIRGLGNMLFALAQWHSRIMCQTADGEMLDSSLLVQAASGNTLQEMSINYMGPFSMLSPGLELIDRKFSARSGSTLPLLGELRGQMGQYASRFTAPEAPEGQAYQNKLGVESKLESMASGDSGAVDLFFCSYDRLIREVCRRILVGPKSDPLVAEFHRRCLRAGVTPDVIATVDHDSTSAFRSFGAGSPAARSLGFKRLLELLPQLDEIGRKRLIFQFVADIVGYQNANYFAQEPEDAVFNGQSKIAELENVLLMMGNAIPVDPGELHATHVQRHVPPLLQTLEGVETGDIDPIQVLPGLQAVLTHISAHGEALAQDPTQAQLYGQVREAVNNLGAVVANMERKIKAAERKAAEAGAAPGGGNAAAINATQLEELKVAAAEFKLSAAQELHNLRMSGEQSILAQKLALNDAKGATEQALKMRYPSA